MLNIYKSDCINAAYERRLFMTTTIANHAVWIYVPFVNKRQKVQILHKRNKDTHNRTHRINQ
jgi:hypothetical protein